MSEEFKARFTADNKDFKRKADQVESRSKKLGKAMMRLAGAFAAAFSVGKIIQWGKESVKAYDQQAKAEQSLLIALKGREDIQQKLIKQAQNLQKETLFGDEETIKAQALAASMGLTYDQISKLIPAAQDLAVATGNTLDFGIKNLARTYSGLSGELGEVIPALRALTQEEMAAGKAIDLVNDLMGGQAKAAAEVGLGSAEQLKNMFGDLKEEVGELIVNTDAFSGSIGFFKNRVTEATEAISELNKLLGSDWMKEEATWIERAAFKLAKFSKQGKEGAAIMNEYLEMQRLVNNAREAEADTIEKYEAMVALLSYQLENLTDKESDEAEQIEESIATYKKAIDLRRKLAKETKEQKTTLSTLNKELEKENSALGDIDVSNKSAIATQVIKILAIEAEIKATTDLIEKLRELEEVKKGVGKGTGPVDKIEGRTEIGLTGTADDEFNKNLASKLKSTEEYTRKNAALYEELKQKQIQKEQEAADERGRILQAAFDSARFLVEGLGNIFSAQKEKELSMVGDNAEKRAQIERKYANIEKGIAIGQATINTAQAVTKALTAAPPPWNLILAGTSAAAGAAQIALIAAQQFAEGGAVSGPTLALVGEAAGISRSNPEYIGTAKQIGQMGGGKTLTARVSQGDLLFILNEGKAHNQRSY